MRSGTALGKRDPMIRKAAEATGIDVQCWATYRLKEPETLGPADDLTSADLILLHPTQDATGMT